LDVFNKAIPDFEDGISTKTFDDTRDKYDQLIDAIKYDSKSAEDAIKEMLNAIKEAAIANGDLYGVPGDTNIDKFFNSTINGYKEYIDKVAGADEIHYLDVFKELSATDLSSVIDAV